MGLSFTNDPFMIADMEAQIQELEKKIKALQNEILFIQSNCRHVYLENKGFRRCQKCNKIEIVYY
ncbi:hypothetical protein [Bacillus sp. 03113]|uniref:hypothetical protein n=1 Tax=Bacillus sp. 03113 TaxID=2578211 RepID=UPI0011450E95|nr:hypothetical protein [Bacillus sp. 03113]